MGILLCSSKDRTKVEFATAGMDNQMFVSRYLVALPKPKQLQKLIEEDRERFEALASQRNAATRSQLTSKRTK